ncbi:MAG: glycosyltransferase [Sulfurimonas sp.]|uniref:glycosyltransferase n=1 Tax=Sulfurimonas sp. TaxID=2022749 RepID=UPI002630BD52|nr:glycosyltransferase [Sulfurimonas sp.]MDD2653096.1 glycosyltransferase [Sulfurimonas sp.]MDD3452481.1 glycosyltransferase [Sulfurimonas sp.]
MDKTVSLVITSCDRFDLLKQTLDSFFKFNTYKLSQIIIIEDSLKQKELEKIINNYKSYSFTIISNKEKLGQLKSIDKAYSLVTSKYIFHCEDDWNFLDYGFIEKSIDILEKDKNILSVWLRNIDELTTIEFSDEVYSTSSNEKYKLVYSDILSFNPSLRRLSEYKLIKNFAQHENKMFERTISDFYKNSGFLSAIFLKPYVEHIGWHRRVLNADKKRSSIIYRLDNIIKKIKASIYKKFSLGKFSKKT